MPDGRLRALALHGAASGWIAAVLVAVYVLAGGGTFWPLWAVATLALAFGAHAIVVVALPSLRPQERAARGPRRRAHAHPRAAPLDVQAAELRRIERDLHDGAQARLVALSMQLGRAEERLERPARGAPSSCASARERGERGASASCATSRAASRPPVLADRGLGGGGRGARRARAPIPVDRRRVDRRAGRCRSVETAAYFVVAEALTNAAKHAGGAARARSSSPTTATGSSSRSPTTAPGGADADAAPGCAGLRHRVEALDGTLTVTSPAGGGTIVRAELPCGS